ncbi:class F sortase [Thermomonospora amylolytica]|uniref:class F sortase n=1 Tax=Thermomonospora amylolytica TaxID=1411117 RepID=UPI000E6C9CB1|nr:class F sortase [Thermomonospora amylolytica]
MTGRFTAAAGRRVLGTAAGVLLTASLLAACGGEDGAAPSGPASSAPPAAGQGTTPAAGVVPLGESRPTRIAIPKIGVSAPVEGVGLLPDGRVQEPPLSRPNLAGWYSEGVTPGEAGPSVILGHVDANKKPAVFYRLKELAEGDRIQVTRQDGSTVTFAVTELRRVDKNAFPHRQVFGEELDHSALRLVTCGGAFDPQSGHYKDNLIVYAKMVAA